MSAASKLVSVARRADRDGARVVWPALNWRGRHREFVRDVLGIRAITSYQLETMDAYYGADRTEIAECTGQKMGKTEKLIALALIDFATEPRQNGFVFGPKLEWIDEAFWPRFALAAVNAFLPCAACMETHAAWIGLVKKNPFDETPRPERCGNCSPLIPSELRDPKHPERGRVSEWLDDRASSGGLRAPDGRIIRGYASRKLGGKGGLSGSVRFYADESSDIDDETREAIAGNMVGGGKSYFVGNMLRRSGWFYRAFRDEKSRYAKTFQRSSRLSPNCRGRIVWSDGVITENTSNDLPVRGLATPEGIEANLRAWKGTHLIAARVDGEAPNIVEGQIIAASTVLAAEHRWTPNDDEQGVLQVGVDVARMRDPIAIAARRGKKIFHIHEEVLGESDHARGVELTTSLLLSLRRPMERPSILVVDASGPEGQAFKKALQLWIVSNPEPASKFTTHFVQMGAPPHKKTLYKQRRDEVIFAFGYWLKTGSIPPDAGLEAEIDSTVSRRVKTRVNGIELEVHEVISNDDVRRSLGRSPNKRDACMLAALDLDGSEQAPAQAAPTAPANQTSPSAHETQVFTPSAHQRHDAIYASLWGRE